MKVFYYMLLIVILCLAWSLVEPQLFRVKRIVLKNKKIRKAVKIVFISDIHYGDYYRAARLRELVSRINSLKPDVVIIGGDYLENDNKCKFKRDVFEGLFFELSKLKSKYGKYTVLGNHEYFLKDKLPLLYKRLEETGIEVIRNESRELGVGKDTVHIHGVDDIQEGIVDTGNLRISREGLNIMVSHNPDFYEEYDIEFDIGLSGHTHGGQVTAFGIYAPVTESKYGQRYVRRINKKKKSVIITTKGLGCSMLPLRFCAFPEIVELIIKKG